MTIATIAELAAQRVVGHEGAIVYDTAKPDGAPRKLMDVWRYSTASAGRPRTSLEARLATAYAQFVAGAG